MMNLNSLYVDVWREIRIIEEIPLRFGERWGYVPLWCKKDINA